MSIKSGCFNLVRGLLIIVNLLVASLACLFIYVSFNAFGQVYELEGLSDSQQPRTIHTYVTVLCAGIGLIVAILSLLGLIGATKRSKSILGTYIAIIVLLVSMLIALIALTYTLASSDAFGGSNRELDKSIVNSTIVLYNYIDQSDMKSQIIDRTQKSFSCCGVNSPSDWNEYNNFKIPKSCCEKPIESSLPVYKYCPDSDFKTGCWKALTDYILENISTLRAVLYSLLAFATICAFAAGFMIHTMRKSLDVV